MRADLQRRPLEHDELERSLLLAGVLLGMRSHIMESLVDPFSSYEGSHAALAQFLSERSLVELAGFIPAGSPFWGQRDALAVDELEGVLSGARSLHPSPVPDIEAARSRARWSAPARQLALAAVEVSGARELGPEVDDLVHRLALAYSIHDDLASMHRHLLNGRTSYPIVFAAEAAGILLHPPPEPTVVLGALVVGGSLARLLEEAEGLISDVRRSAARLGLSVLCSFIDDAEPFFRDRSARAAGRASSPPADAAPGHQRAPLVRIVERAPAKAMAMAERFLLADPELRESWEVHREGIFGADEVVSRFPAGLILETLAGAGHDVAAPVACFLDQTVANRFRYYDHRWCDADSDTLGVFLRLQARSGLQPQHAEPLATVLDCLERDVATHGFIPVWITACTEHDPERPPTVALGEHCGTVAANLLLGLCTTDRHGQATTLRVGATHLLERIAQVGVGANVDYPPLFAMATFFRLLRTLQDAAPDAVPAGGLAAARASLDAELLRRSSARRLGAQDAALSLIACHAAGQPELAAAEWTTVVLKKQRPDGGWPAEPFAAVPNRGGWVSWYASNLLTTALCYEALRCSNLD